MTKGSHAETTIKRGIVLSPADFTWDEWIERIAGVGLNYVGIHSSLEAIISFLDSPAGQAVLAAAERNRVDVNFELHVMSELLPRGMFAERPELYRMDESGKRTPDANLCVSSADAISIVQENTLRVAAVLRKFHDVNRYHFWPHDNRPWCLCAACSNLSFSDQALVLTNAMCEALREQQLDAQVAHLAYATTIETPARVRPARGVFLQYAPIFRCYDHGLDDPSCDKNRGHIAGLRRLCGYFGSESAEVLEYWLDVSLFSSYNRPAIRLPFSEQVLQRDVAFYRGFGIRRFSTFGVYIDADYVRRFGPPPLAEYARALRTTGSA